MLCITELAEKSDQTSVDEKKEELQKDRLKQAFGEDVGARGKGNRAIKTKLTREQKREQQLAKLRNSGPVAPPTLTPEAAQWAKNLLAAQLEHNMKQSQEPDNASTTESEGKEIADIKTGLEKETEKVDELQNDLVKEVTQIGNDLPSSVVTDESNKKDDDDDVSLMTSSSFTSHVSVGSRKSIRTVKVPDRFEPGTKK